MGAAALRGRAEGARGAPPLHDSTVLLWLDVAAAAAAGAAAAEAEGALCRGTGAAALGKLVRAVGPRRDRAAAS